MPSPPTRLPPWIRAKVPGGQAYRELKDLARSCGLHTICEEARCPNLGECWARRTATFLLLGDTCTRNCRFCSVRSGRPVPLDLKEPQRVAQAVQALGLEHLVVTSVDRDDLDDGGASVFAAVVRRVRAQQTGCTVEVLIPDYGIEPLGLVIEARPDVLGHNVETAARLFPRMQPRCDYQRSLDVLRKARSLWPEAVTKSGLMVGLGETMDEVLDTMGDLRRVDVDVLTIGQYLQPTGKHAPVARYYTPAEFDELREQGYGMGFRRVESGPLVRSSYRAEGHVLPRPRDQSGPVTTSS